MQEEKSLYMFKLFSLIWKVQGLKSQGFKDISLSSIKSAIFLTLIFDKGVSQSMIVNKMAVAKQTINNIIMELYEKGYVKTITDKSDKRLKILVLTEKGNEYAKTYLNPIIELDKKLFDKLGKDKIRKMTDDLSELAEILSEVNKGGI